MAKAVTQNWVKSGPNHRRLPNETVLCQKQWPCVFVGWNFWNTKQTSKMFVQICQQFCPGYSRSPSPLLVEIFRGGLGAPFREGLRIISPVSTWEIWAKNSAIWPQTFVKACFRKSPGTTSETFWAPWLPWNASSASRDRIGLRKSVNSSPATLHFLGSTISPCV